MTDWKRLRQLGKWRFVLRFGVMRLAPLLAMPVIAVIVVQGGSLSSTRWAAFVALYTVIGTIWGLATWRSCERRWLSSSSTCPADE